jgi:hypothetical protein
MLFYGLRFGIPVAGRQTSMCNDTLMTRTLETSSENRKYCQENEKSFPFHWEGLDIDRPTSPSYCSKKVRVLFVSIQYHLLYEIHKDILRPQINLLVTVTVSGIMVNQSHESDSIYDEVVYRMRMTTSTLFQLAGQLTTRILILQVD